MSFAVAVKQKTLVLALFSGSGRTVMFGHTK
jgi:hypothetical protein